SCLNNAKNVIPNLFRDLVLILSAGDGGPLTDNVVFTAISGFFLLSLQRFLSLQLLFRRTGP
ncbi:hypothetical protein, partial [Mesotoga prima]|uniref:hypothetical protein n=1 Tax=Mesotoga prima TaxID=1184387 RepID=UPI002FDA695D